MKNRPTDEHAERKQLADGEEIDRPRALSHAEQVDERQGTENPDDEQHVWQAAGHRWNVEAQRQRNAVGHTGPAGKARHPLHPADLEPDQPAKRRARVDVRAAGHLEATADLGEAERDEQRRQPGEGKRHDCPGADLLGYPRRQKENPAADHLVDADRHQVPSAERASERGWSRHVVSTSRIRVVWRRGEAVSSPGIGPRTS